MPLPVLIISIVLFFVLFFGIGFIINMLFRSAWIMLILFPIIAILIVNKAKLIEYVRQPLESVKQLGANFAALQSADIIILLSGLLGAFLAGAVTKLLRKKGYQMF